MRIALSVTAEESELLTRLSQKNHHGRGLTNMLVVNLDKKLPKLPSSEQCCATEDAAVRTRKYFDLPGRLDKQIICAARRLKVSHSALVRMLIVEPILIDILLGSGGNTPD